MFISYFDESTSQDKTHVLVAAVIAKETEIGKIEEVFSFLRKFENPDNRFAEFHATDLFHAKGVFKDIGREEASRIVYKQAHFIGASSLSVVYAFVDVQKHKDSVHRGATPLSVAFQKCLAMVEAKLASQAPDESAIAIFDDPDDAEVKNDLETAFRNLRNPLTGELEHFRDDLLFGNSAFSAGLQMADLCAFLCRRHEEEKENTEEMYLQFSELLEGRADALE